MLGVLSWKGRGLIPENSEERTILDLVEAARGTTHMPPRHSVILLLRPYSRVPLPSPVVLTVKDWSLGE